MAAKTTANRHLHPVFRDALAPFTPPAQFTEEQLTAADVEYLATQRERDARRLAETASLERAYVARRGWSL